MNTPKSEQHSILIGERWITTNRWFSVHNKYDERVIGQVPIISKIEIEDCLSSARKGVRISRDLLADKRHHILLRFSRLVKAKEAYFIDLISTEGVKTITEAKKEVVRCINTIELSAKLALKRDTDAIAHIPSQKGVDVTFKIEPVGLILAITPYNDPLNLVAHKICPAIASGNAVILKPSDYTPLTAILFTKLLIEAGLPYHVLNLITGPQSEYGDSLVTSKAVDMISFTGGNMAASKISKAAGIKKMTLELGSCSPSIVMEDCGDLEDVAANLFEGIIWAGGQNCIGVKRIFAHARIYDELTAKLISKASQIVLGDPKSKETSYGPLVSERLKEEVFNDLKEYKNKGFKLLTGGKFIGNSLTTTLLEAEISNPIQGEKEIFAPVCILMKFEDIDDAIKASNHSPYGLHAAIFTRNPSHVKKAKNELNCGGLIINNCSDFRIDNMPFGGVKESGHGQEGVEYAFDEFTFKKVFVNFN